MRHHVPYARKLSSAGESAVKETHQDWTFFSNHGHVYFLLTAQEGITIREVANRVGLTERAVIGIIGDLVVAGYIRREKVGRNNRYFAVPDRALRHPLEANVQLHDLRRLINQGSSTRADQPGTGPGEEGVAGK